MADSADAQPAKRGRGRPPKKTAQPGAKKAGRPKKEEEPAADVDSPAEDVADTPSDTQEEAYAPETDEAGGSDAKGKRGRPKKADSEEGDASPKKRGRKAAAPAKPAASGEDGGAKRGRGRPPKAK